MPKFFLAILPPHKISKDIIEIQRELERLYLIKHAQKAPPHITIIPPFLCEKDKVDLYIESLQSFLQSWKNNSFTISLNKFQHFDFRTLFIDVEKNEALIQLRREIKIHFGEHKIVRDKIEKHFFLPHITLANKDLKKKDFKIVWESFKNREFKASFLFMEIAVLKNDGGIWSIYKKLTV